MVGSRRGRALAFSLSRYLKAVVVMAAGFAMCLDASAAGKRTVVGTIQDYGCGDFCHLIVVDARGKKHDALCGAPLCRPWADAGGVMPRRFVGRKVRATVTNEPVEYEGETMQFDVFRKIELLR
jgi:hypothetical protein